MSKDKPPKPLNPPEASGSPLSIQLVEGEIEQVAQAEIADLPPDPLAKAEEISLETRLPLKEQKRKQELAEQHELHLTRLGYVPRLFWLIVAWLAVTSIFLGFDGFHLWGFTLSEKILIALITSTTANVLGLFYVVAKWLYPAPFPEKPKTPKNPAGRISATEQ